MKMLLAQRGGFRPFVPPSSSTCQRAQPPLNSLQRSRLLARIAAITCSSAWTSAVFSAAEAAVLDPTLISVAKALRDRGMYPPPIDAGQRDLPRRHPVRMRRCGACGRYVPPNNLAEHKLIRVCDDCRIEPDSVEEALEKASGARTPGVQFRVLVEGAVAGATARQAARKKLNEFGLTDQEITVLAFLIEGYSTRRIARFIERSQTFVLKIRRTAEQKVRRSGCSATLDYRTTHLPEQRARAVDPLKLDAIGSWNV